MGELTDDERGVGRQAEPFDDDPFAELARLIDTTEAERPAVAPAPPLEELHFESVSDPEFDLDMDAFAGALDEELARDSVSSAAVVAAAPPVASAVPAPKAAASYSSWLSPAPRMPVVTVPAAPSVSSAAPSAQAAAEEPVSDPVLEAAFRGLSAPANPRDSKYQESEAFAPARKADAAAHEPTAQLFDDFDALIASELAAMQKPVPAVPAAEATPVFAMYGSAERDAPASGHEDYSQADPEVRQAAHAARRQAGSSRRVGFAATGASPGAARQPMSRRMMSVGASLLVIALVGGAGAYMLTGDGGKVYDAPLIVQADPEPVKVAPKDPGGRAIPNQNKAVYERVQSADAAIEPSQQTLLTAAEEPAELPQPEPEPALSDLPGVDLNPIGTALAAEPIRVADAGDSSPIAVLTPRRVRTLTVNPDGTLVATEQVPSTSLQELRGENPALIEAASRPIGSLETGAPAAQAASDTAAEGDPAPGIPMPSMKPGTEPAAPVQVAAAAPAEPQPTAVVTEAAPAEVPAAIEAPAPEPVATEVAALPAATPPAAAAEGSYYVQISSHPSREAAEDSSRTLGQRFSDVIGGRSLVIQSADIPGKGTYHRVRVATGSKNEANDLCQRLKSAGGSCFVSR
ncbi:hypothetical protein GTW51_00240 [Aurantimonas aggregata]|uniref:SPOR domain-containing protein n=1 Tax=Aurantimonas aggregata TaxID=2047720 RepID=A0A6L9MBD9_9HYPH|nr:SPOR domain-containing protein [Aurantimonas aggregata]NDV85124.1 hypothetical protein [Aurantimonas aggregata]